MNAALRVIDGKPGLVANGVDKTYNQRPEVRSVSDRLRRVEEVCLVCP